MHSNLGGYCVGPTNIHSEAA